MKYDNDGIGFMELVLLDEYEVVDTVVSRLIDCENDEIAKFLMRGFLPNGQTTNNN